MTKPIAFAVPGRTFMVCLLLAGFLLISTQVSAGQLTVRIFERGGTAPIEDAAVCLGTAARLSQFGADYTDADGYVVFTDVPLTPLLITASMPGFMSRQERMGGSIENRMLVLSLPTGGGGVECPLDRSAMAEKSIGLAVRSFQLNSGVRFTASRTVVLNNVITGRANQYRASESPEFTGAVWRPYERSPRFTLSAGVGVKTVYFQVRRHALINGADIESRSRVLQDRINLKF